MGETQKEAFSRTQRLLGGRAMDQLCQAVVAVFGVGGVGSYTVEALARSGVGHFILVDPDAVSVTNINRQLVASWKTVGLPRYRWPGSGFWMSIPMPSWKHTSCSTGKNWPGSWIFPAFRMWWMRLIRFPRSCC